MWSSRNSSNNRNNRQRPRRPGGSGRPKGPTSTRTQSVFNDEHLTKALVKYLLKSYETGQHYRHIFGTLMRMAHLRYAVGFGQQPSGNDLDILRSMVQYINHEAGLTKLPIDQQVRANNRVQELAGVMNEANIAVGTKGYLDYGCGDGSITVAIGKALDLPPIKVFGMDIFDLDHETTEMVYLKLDPQCSSIPLADQSIDFITAYVAFHHLATPEQTAQEMARVSTPKVGTLIIREHDLDPQKQPIVARFLNLIHAIVILQGIGETGLPSDQTPRSDPASQESPVTVTGSWNQQKQQLEAYFNTIHYHDKAYWDRLLEDAGYHLIKHTSYQGVNPQKLYYGVYRKAE